MAYIKVYYNLLERLKPYSDAEIGRLLRGLLEYASSGIQPDFKGNERFIWPTLQEMVDNDAQAYADKCAQMSQNGSKGGRPRKAKGFSENQTVTEKAKGFSENQTVTRIKNKEYITPPTPPQGETPDGGGASRYIDEHIRGMTPGNWEELRSYLDDGLTMELVQHAVDEAAAQGKRNWAYVRGILNRYLTEGVTTVEQSKGADQKPKKTRLETYCVVVNGEVVERTREVTA
jgi:DnaD/phage-associated family protein